MADSLVNNEFEGIWNEVILVLFTVLTWNLAGGIEENYESS
jgi:hypothetical protein